MSSILNFSINDRRFSIDVHSNKIESILLYGSYATGNPDPKSDIDLMIIVDSKSMEEHEKLREKILADLKIPDYWLNLFSKSFIKHLCESGDFLMWHIALYSKEIYSRSRFISYTLNNMNKKVNPIEEISHSMDYIIQLHHEHLNGTCGNCEFLQAITCKLRIMAALVCFMNGSLEFDKYNAINACYSFEGMEVPFSMDEYRKLYSIKQEYSYSNEEITFEGMDEYIKTWYEHFKVFSESAFVLSQKYDIESNTNPLLAIK